MKYMMMMKTAAVNVGTWAQNFDWKNAARLLEAGVALYAMWSGREVSYKNGHMSFSEAADKG